MSRIEAGSMCISQESNSHRPVYYAMSMSSGHNKDLLLAKLSSSLSLLSPSSVVPNAFWMTRLLATGGSFVIGPSPPPMVSCISKPSVVRESVRGESGSPFLSSALKSRFRVMKDSFRLFSSASLPLSDSS